jgi:hypothetical protein
LQSVSTKFSEFLAGDFAISLLQHLAEFGPFEAAPTANILQIKILIATPSCVPKRFLFGPHPQQPVHRTHPARPFDFGGLATT